MEKPSATPHACEHHPSRLPLPVYKSDLPSLVPLIAPSLITPPRNISGYEPLNTEVLQRQRLALAAAGIHIHGFVS